MSIADQVTRLQDVKSDIITSIINKGVDVPSGTMLGDLPRYIQDIGYNVIGGRAYRTVTIGGVTWLAENLDFKAPGISIGPSYTPSTPAAWYYENNENTYGFFGNKYGLLYNWYAVKHLNDNRATFMQGWHVPTMDEWNALAEVVGGNSVAGTKLKSTSGWNSGNGTDDYGFSLFPAGIRTDNFYDVGNYTNVWTATENSPSTARSIFVYSSASLARDNNSKTYYAYPVRLVKD